MDLKHAKKSQGFADYHGVGFFSIFDLRDVAMPCR